MRSQFILVRPITLVATITWSRAFREASQLPMMFGAPLRFGLGRHGVDLGGFEDIYAAVNRVVHLCVAIGF